MESLLKRKSIRKYTSQPVADEIVRDLLHAAMSAPSAANQQPWHFVVVRDRNILASIAEVHPYAFMLNQAPLAIVVCATEELGDFKHYWVQDCAAATENILTAAVANGLGGVWLGVHPRQNVQEIKQLLKLPAAITPFSVVSIGYPDEFPEAGNRYDRSRVHYDTW
ncbi:nitroreductase family protein [Anaeroselena agilis]|uniref:Nitroreductase family protein n=1 Tax=Anaeroselena agilis TaxID=3063788 RepID=A0ABU3NUD3_9FIRM|nr:nitroreductase family protein [Selenomonadales bacterium 4137-cl]